MECVSSDMDKAHPVLYLPEVLESIFMWCSVPDLKACRLVSTTWLDSSQKSWRDIASVRMGWVGKLAEYLSFLESRKRDGVTHVYKKYKLSFIAFTDHATFSPFWSQCGAHVKVLDMSGCRFPTLRSFKQVIYNYCPNIEELKLRAVEIGNIGTSRVRDIDILWSPCRFDCNENLKSLNVDAHSTRGIAWMDLFENFPMLEHFEFSGKDAEFEIAPIFEALLNIHRADSNKLRLKSLKYEYRNWNPAWGGAVNTLPPSMSQYLTAAQIHLEDLSMMVVGNIHETTITKILGFHRDSLKRLELIQAGGDKFLEADTCFSCGSMYPDDVIFPNLREITLHSRVFTSLSFLRATPNLRKLVLLDTHKFSGMISATPGMRDVRLEKCTELEVDDLLPAGDMKKLISWLPNLTHLKTDVNNETFAMVCEAWNNLVSLAVLNGRLDECGFTGLDDDQVDRVNNAEGNGEFERAAVANITDLKHLRNLFIRKWHGFNGPHSEYRYCSIVHGILELPSLKKLDIGNNLMNEEMIDILVTSLSENYSSNFVKVKSDYGSHQIEIH